MITMEQFGKKFIECYNWLYSIERDCFETETDWHKFQDTIKSGGEEFNKLIATSKGSTLASRFAAYRGDVILSDIEATAFMLAVEELGCKDE